MFDITRRASWLFCPRLVLLHPCGATAPLTEALTKAPRVLWREAGGGETLIYRGEWKMCCPDFVCGVFSEVGHAFPAKTLMNSAVGQPLGKEILGSLGPPTGFISQFPKEVDEFVVVGPLGNFRVLLVPSSVLQDTVECGEHDPRFGFALGGAPVVCHPALLSLRAVRFVMCLLHIAA